MGREKKKDCLVTHNFRHLASSSLQTQSPLPEPDRRVVSTKCLRAQSSKARGERESERERERERESSLKLITSPSLSTRRYIYYHAAAARVFT